MGICVRAWFLDYWWGEWWSGVGGVFYSALRLPVVRWCGGAVVQWCSENGGPLSECRISRIIVS